MAFERPLSRKKRCQQIIGLDDKSFSVAQHRAGLKSGAGSNDDTSMDTVI